MRTTLIALAAVSALTLAGCGDGDETEQEAPPSPSATTPSPADTADASPGRSAASSEVPRPEDEGAAQEIRIDGDTVVPSARRVDLDVGERLTVRVASDRAGELHVHSNPEQELAFGRGRTVLHIVVGTPGLVEVEEHESGAVILRLYVS